MSIASSGSRQQLSAAPPTTLGGKLPVSLSELSTLYQVVLGRWKSWGGEKPKGVVLAKINAVARQVANGDCPDTADPTETDDHPVSEPELLVMDWWRKYKGTSKETAMRRFLTLMRQVNPALLEGELYKDVPYGFPKDESSGVTICPYSNSVRGCPQPLTDRNGNELEQEIETNEELADFVKLQGWLESVSSQQRCCVGLHKALNEDQVKPFLASFYSGPECAGFRQFDSTSINRLIKKMLRHQFEQLVYLQDQFQASKMGTATAFVSRDILMHQRDKVLGLEYFYRLVSGEEFKHDMPCQRSNHQCDTRRLADGGNHMHGVVIERPPVDLSEYDAVLQLRFECERLGIPVSTGPVQTSAHRMEVLKLKIADFHRKELLVFEARRRMDRRRERQPAITQAVGNAALVAQKDQLIDTLEAGDVPQMCILIERGAPPDIETWWGMFPLLCACIARDKTSVQKLVELGADVDHCNAWGMTSLQWMVKKSDLVMIQCLIDAGAKVEAEGGLGQSAFHLVAKCGLTSVFESLCESAVKVNGGGPSGETAKRRYLDAGAWGLGQATPLMLAAQHRNEGMVRLLLRHGANLFAKDTDGCTAAAYATKAGWQELGLWLRDTRAVGPNGIYTYADIQAENSLAGGNEVLVKAISRTRVSTDQPAIVGIMRGGQAAPDTETDEALTALATVCYTGAGGTQTVAALISMGCDPSHVNSKGRTPLMAAAAAGNRSAILQLLHYGADASPPDLQGWVASRFAEEIGEHDLARILSVAAQRGPAAAILVADQDSQKNTRTGLKKGGSQHASVSHVQSEAVPEPPKIFLTHEEDLELSHQIRALTRASANASYTSNSLAQGSSLGTSTIEFLEQLEGKGEGEREAKRCPKCTLVVPCVHFASQEELDYCYRNGYPEWRWFKRPVQNSRKIITPETCVEDSTCVKQATNVSMVDVLYKAHKQKIYQPPASEDSAYGQRQTAESWDPNV